MTGRLLETHSPRRQQRRFSNLVSPAAVDSFPRACSTGVAVKIGCGDAGPFQEPPAMASLVANLPAGEPCGHVRVGRGRTFNSLGRELGGKAAQDFTDLYPRLGSDWLRHPQRMEKADGKVREAISAKLSGA